MEVAEKLGTTQAAISQYLRLKRGHKSLDQFANLLPVIQSAANTIAQEIASGKISSEEVTLKFCELCLAVQRRRFSTE